MAQFWLSYAHGSLRHLDDVMHSRHVNKDFVTNVTTSLINYDHLPTAFIPDEFSAAEIGSHGLDFQRSGARKNCNRSLLFSAVGKGLEKYAKNLHHDS